MKTGFGRASGVETMRVWAAGLSIIPVGDPVRDKRTGLIGRVVGKRGCIYRVEMVRRNGEVFVGSMIRNQLAIMPKQAPSVQQQLMQQSLQKQSIQSMGEREDINL